MGLLTDMIAELKETITAAVGLPEPPAGAINWLTTIQGTKKSFVEQVKVGRISLPFVVLGIGDFTMGPDSDGAVNSNGYMVAPVTVHYVGQWTNANQGSVFNEIYAVKVAIDKRPSTLTTCTRIEEGKILTDVDSPINSSLLANSEVQVIASALQYMPGLRTQLY